MAGQNELNIHDYLDATSQASARTRTVVIVLVVSSVLTGVGILNSIPENWPLYRVQESAKLNSGYVKEKLDIGSPDRAAYERIADDLIIKEHVTEPNKMSKIRTDAEEKYKRFVRSRSRSTRYCFGPTTERAELEVSWIRCARVGFCMLSSDFWRWYWASQFGSSGNGIESTGNGGFAGRSCGRKAMSKSRLIRCWTFTSLAWKRRRPSSGMKNI